MYNTIGNPESGKAVSIYGTTGRKVLQKYGIQYGGQGKSTNKTVKPKSSPKTVQIKSAKKLKVSFRSA